MTISDNTPGNLPGGIATGGAAPVFVPAGDVPTSDGRGNFPFQPGGGEQDDTVIQVSNSTGDVAAIVNAMATATTGGKLDGRLVTQQAKYARITTPTTITLGYIDTENDQNWGIDTTEKVKLALDIRPDAGLGAALTIKGGFGCELDINVLGGGAQGIVTDAATTQRTTSADGSIAFQDTVLNTPTGAFTAADVGASVSVPTAGGTAPGGGAIPLIAQILTVNSPTSVTLSSAAQAVAAGVAVTIGSRTISSAAAIAGGLQPGAVIELDGAGPAPEGVPQPLMASVRTVNALAGTFTVSEGAWAQVSGATMNWMDVAIRLEDHVGLKLNVYGKNFLGCLVATDATDDPTKRLRVINFDRINGVNVGRTIFWKAMESHGSLGKIWSANKYGDYVGLCADLTWDHWEGGVSGGGNPTAKSYLWFDRCNQLNGPSVSAGDRASEAIIKITGDSAGSESDIGRFRQIRCTTYVGHGTGTITHATNTVTGVINTQLTFKLGQLLVAPGVPDGAKITALSANGPGPIGNGWTSGSPGTITFGGSSATADSAAQQLYGMTCEGLKLIGVSSVEIAMLDTSRSIAGLHVVGGGENGIKVKLHRSLTIDNSALVVDTGTIGTTPRIDVCADWRFMLGYAIDLKAGLAAGTDIRVSGYSETMHVNGGATGLYAARCASPLATLDVARHRQLTRAGGIGFIDPTTVKLVGRSLARLENDTPIAGQFWVTDGNDDYALQTAPVGATVKELAVGIAQVVVTNTVTDTLIAGPYTIPASSVAAGTTYRLRAWGTVDNAAAATVTIRCRLGGVAGSSIADPLPITNASAKTGQGWFIDYNIIFRAAASASTPVALGGLGVSNTNGTVVPQGEAQNTVNMTVSRDLVLDATWGAASASNILRCEGFTLEQVK